MKEENGLRRNENKFRLLQFGLDGRKQFQDSNCFMSPVKKQFLGWLGEKIFKKRVSVTNIFFDEN